MAGKKIKYDHTKDKVSKSYIGMSASMAAVQVRKQEKKAFRDKLKADENYIIRIEAHGIITRGLQEGKSEEEVLKLLSDKRYDKYREYYPIWISDRAKKFEKSKIQREK